MKEGKVRKRKAKGTKSAGQDLPGITKKAIRKRAYEIYIGREPHEGTPEDDWFRAEEELYSDPGY